MNSTVNAALWIKGLPIFYEPSQSAVYNWGATSRLDKQDISG